MFYIIAKWLESIGADLPGLGLFQYITFRAAGAAITALLISFFFGPKIIRLLRRGQIGEQAKEELQSVGRHASKAGTPTMGGLIVLLSLLLPTVLWADIIDNAFIIIIVLVTVWLGAVGFLDDYLKVVKKKQKGLIGKYKIVGQVAIGLIVGSVIYFFPDLFPQLPESLKQLSTELHQIRPFEELRTLTTTPFSTENLNLDWSILYIPMAVFIITATSNAVNLTDGLDGLAIGTVGIAALAMALISYVSGNVKFASYLNIMYLHGSGELTIFCAALVGGALGFLWFNSFPAQVFMGDTGALALGGALGTLALLVKKELLLPIVGGIFFAETMSVILQKFYFKWTKKKFGEGGRLFKMAPLHHHFEKAGWPEPKIVLRFYIIAVMLAIITMATFKVR